MFIAFEGPDKVGKSTSAEGLAHNAVSIYNATRGAHTDMQREQTWHDKEGLRFVQTYDRIDWFTHMVYRLALPEKDWNDERPRTVFAMPDTHLVVKLHHPELAGLIADELYDTGTLARVNPVYYYFADFFAGLNVERDYALFKSVSIIEVSHDPRDGTFSQKLVDHSSKGLTWGSVAERLVNDDASLLSFLQYVDQRA
jgi:hypothetical protein